MTEETVTPPVFRRAVLEWFDLHGRKNLPWQQPRDPYRVWVSEIMLQQTQVATVIPYFQRFMTAFPTVQALALADEDQVMARWAGLGYYARARNLHKAARQIEENGVFPRDLDGLMALPGVGRSTAGAILSMAFRQRAAILDGNVKRVLCRVFAVHGWPGSSAVSQRLWALSEDYTPLDRVEDYTQAMMDLGATLCIRSKPLCLLCPLQAHCRAFREHLTAQLPERKPARKVPVKEGVMLFLRDHHGRLLLEKRPPAGIWGGLWCVPQFADMQEMDAYLASQGLVLAGRQVLARKRHTFSHYHYDFQPVMAVSGQQEQHILRDSARVWYDHEQMLLLGLPAPVLQIVNAMAEYEVSDDANRKLREAGD